MNVTIYSTSTCAICHAEMQWLEKKGVAYNNVVVDESDEAMNQLMTATGGAFQTPPFTVVAKNDGSEEKIAGFDTKKLTVALGV